MLNVNAISVPMLIIKGLRTSATVILLDQSLVDTLLNGCNHELYVHRKLTDLPEEYDQKGPFVVKTTKNGKPRTENFPTLKKALKKGSGTDDRTSAWILTTNDKQVARIDLI